MTYAAGRVRWGVLRLCVEGGGGIYSDGCRWEGAGRGSFVRLRCCFYLSSSFGETTIYAYYTLLLLSFRSSESVYHFHCSLYPIPPNPQIYQTHQTQPTSTISTATQSSIASSTTSSTTPNVLDPLLRPLPPTAPHLPHRTLPLPLAHRVRAHAHAHARRPPNPQTRPLRPAPGLAPRAAARPRRQARPRSPAASATAFSPLAAEPGRGVGAAGGGEVQDCGCGAGA